MSLPASAINDLLSDFTAQLDVLQHLAERVQHGRGSHPTPECGIQILTDSEGTQAYQRLLGTATSGIRCMARPPIVGAPLWRQTSNIVEVLRSGRTWRDIYDNATIHSEEILGHLREVGAAGEQSRTLPRVPLKMVIADDERALVAVESNGSNYHLMVGRCGLLTDLIDLFESLWSFATPIPDRTCPSGMPHGPSHDDRELLSLLAAGATDDAIGRQLGMSLRTVQRRVRKLEDMLGARSRFQAGIQAARRNLI